MCVATAASPPPASGRRGRLQSQRRPLNSRLVSACRQHMHSHACHVFTFPLLRVAPCRCLHRNVTTRVLRGSTSRHLASRPCSATERTLAAQARQRSNARLVPSGEMTRLPSRPRKHPQLNLYRRSAADSTMARDWTGPTAVAHIDTSFCTIEQQVPGQV